MLSPTGLFQSKRAPHQSHSHSHHALPVHPRTFFCRPAEPVTAEDGTFSFNVSITSGALEPISITPEMFRVYTLDGKSYISDTAPDTEQFGAHTLQSKEVYTGTFSVKIPTDSEPAMFLADLRPIGDRHFPGA